MTAIDLVVRTVVALAVVVGLMWAMTKLPNRMRRRGGRGARIDVISSRGISRGATVSLVRVADRVLVLGTTQQSMSVLAELSPDEVAEDDTPDVVPRSWRATGTDKPSRPGTGMPSVLFGAPSPGSAWMADLLERLRERTVRRP